MIARSIALATAALVLGAQAPAPSRAPAPADSTSFATAADIRAAVAAMAREMKPGQGFHMRTLVRGDGTGVALEYWTRPGKPAVHPTDAEYATVIEGTGVLLSGGTLVDPSITSPGLVEGVRIHGGTRRALGPGDAFLIPAGVPHWFGITGGKLVLLGTKLPK